MKLTTVFKSVIGTCVVAYLSIITATAQDPNFHIYLCFGQSNMEGNGVIETQDQGAVDARFQVMGAVNCNQNGKTYSLGKWTTGKAPIVRCNTGLGPSDYFGRTMVANLPTNIKIGLVPVAIGGCDIALFDKANYAAYVATAPDWMVGTINAYGGNPYARLVEVAKLAMKDGVIKGILLHQGETNSGQTTWPTKIKAIYDNLIKDLGLDPTKTPLLAGELVTTAQGGACGGHNAIIAKLPSVIPNSHVVSAANLPHKGDGLHFTPASYRTLGQRYADKMLTLLPKGTAPTVSITAPANNSSFTTLQTITITANAADADGTVSKVEFYDGATLLGSDNTSSYSYAWSGMAAGSHTITAKATDNTGSVTTSSAVMVTVTGVQAPYKGAAWPIPGRIEMENYDLGGSGVAYMDGSAGSSTTVTYRTGDDVDLEVCTDAGGGYNLGYATAGEWLEYTVTVASAGQYDLDFRVACNGTGRTVSVSMDGTTIANNVAVTNTGDWQIWSTVSLKGIQLKSGQQVLRLTIGSTDYVNLNYLEFKKSITTGIEETDIAHVVAFPNPFGAQGLTIAHKGNFSYQITNTSGTVLEEGKGEIEHVVGTTLPSGIYFLTVENDSKVVVEKILKR